MVETKESSKDGKRDRIAGKHDREEPKEMDKESNRAGKRGKKEPPKTDNDGKQDRVGGKRGREEPQRDEVSNRDRVAKKIKRLRSDFHVFTSSDFMPTEGEVDGVPFKGPADLPLSTTQKLVKSISRTSLKRPIIVTDEKDASVQAIRKTSFNVKNAAEKYGARAITIGDGLSSEVYVVVNVKTCAKEMGVNSTKLMVDFSFYAARWIWNRNSIKKEQYIQRGRQQVESEKIADAKAKPTEPAYYLDENGNKVVQASAMAGFLETVGQWANPFNYLNPVEPEEIGTDEEDEEFEDAMAELSVEKDDALSDAEMSGVVDDVLRIGAPDEETKFESSNSFKNKALALKSSSGHLRGKFRSFTSKHSFKGHTAAGAA